MNRDAPEIRPLRRLKIWSSLAPNRAPKAAHGLSSMTRSHRLFLAPLWLLATLSFAACVPTAPVTNGPATTVQSGPATPPGAPEGTCWHRNTSPAVIETVTEQVQVQPEQVNEAGQVTRPAVFRTVTRQDIVQPRHDSWIEIPCPAQMTPEFIASVQRALTARGYSPGGITGRMDRSTRIALRRYQKETGLDSSALSMNTARQLGLIAISQ